MNLLQNTFDSCDATFRPKGVHPLFQNTATNFLSQPTTAEAINNQGLAVVASPAPTVEMRRTRRRSILENTFDLLATASRRNAIANDPNQDGDQAIEAINDIESNSNLIQVFNQSSSSSSLSSRGVIQSEENTQLPELLSELNVSLADSSSGSGYSSRTSSK